MAYDSSLFTLHSLLHAPLEKRCAVRKELSRLDEAKCTQKMCFCQRTRNGNDGFALFNLYLIGINSMGWGKGYGRERMLRNTLTAYDNNKGDNNTWKL